MNKPTLTDNPVGLIFATSEAEGTHKLRRGGGGQGDGRGQKRACFAEKVTGVTASATVRVFGRMQQTQAFCRHPHTHTHISRGDQRFLEIFCLLFLVVVVVVVAAAAHQVPFSRLK